MTTLQGKEKRGEAMRRRLKETDFSNGQEKLK